MGWLFKKLFTPFVANEWYINIIIKIPQVAIGAILAFHFGPNSFGMPWSSPEPNLSLFEVTPRFLRIAGNFFAPFNENAYALGLFSGVVKYFGGIFLILGLGSKIVCALILILMTIFLINRHAINFNYVFPLFFFSVSCFGLYLGSGKYGLDYVIAPKRKEPDIE